MMDRIYFKNSQDCFKFFDDSRSGSKLNSWKALANQLKTTRCVLDNYRLRKLCLPEDRFYYYNKLSPICKSLFNINPKISFRDNAIRLDIHSKRLFEMLTERFFIPKGVKCYSVKIPIEIINSE